MFVAMYYQIMGPFYKVVDGLFKHDVDSKNRMTCLILILIFVKIVTNVCI